jgi:hypothetical protein
MFGGVPYTDSYRNLYQTVEDSVEERQRLEALVDGSGRNAGNLSRRATATEVTPASPRISRSNTSMPRSTAPVAPPLSPKASAGDTNGGASGSGVRKGKQRRPPRGNMSQGSLMPGDVGRSKEVMEYGVGQSARAAIYGATASPDGGRRSKQSTDIGGGRRPRPSTDRGGGRRPRQSTDHGGGRWPRQSTDGAFVPPMRIEVLPCSPLPSTALDVSHLTHSHPQSEAHYSALQNRKRFLGWGDGHSLYDALQ